MKIWLGYSFYFSFSKKILVCAFVGVNSSFDGNG